jgi:hypothetical protein
MGAPELNWGWPEIVVTMIWKLAPNGFVMLTEDLVALPRDRVMLDDRQPDKIVISFVTLATARRLMAPERGENRATLSELQGRWYKTAAVLAWKWTRSGLIAKAGVTLTEYDRQAVPGHLVLMASGHADGIEYQFLPRTEAKRIEDWDRENEGIIIKEKLN